MPVVKRRSHIVEERTRPDIPSLDGEIDGIAEPRDEDCQSMAPAVATPEARAPYADGARFIGRIVTFTVKERAVVPGVE
jgi:hypothetical protein